MKLKIWSVWLLTAVVMFSSLAYARTTPVRAALAQDSMEASFWAGYTSTFLYGLNTELTDWRTMLDVMGYTDGLRVNQGGSAINLGVNLDFPLTRDLKVGPRLGLLFAIPAEVHGIRHAGTYHYDWTNTMSGTMLALAGGLVYTPWKPSPFFSLSMGMDLGLGLVFADWKSKFQTDDSYWPANQYNYDIPLSGSCLYLDLNTTAKYFFDSNKNVFLRLGYRISDMDYLTIGKDFNNLVPFNDIRSGTPFRGLDNHPIPYDLSGFEIGAGVEIAF